MADLSNITLKGVSLKSIVDEEAQLKIPKTTSGLVNDANYVKTTGTVSQAVHADKTASLTQGTGVVAGTYGPSANVTIGNTQTGSINIPQFTVNAQGLVTSVVNRKYTIANKCSNCSQCSNCNQCSVTSGCSQCTNCSETTCKYNECSDCSYCNKYP